MHACHVRALALTPAIAVDGMRPSGDVRWMCSLRPWTNRLEVVVCLLSNHGRGYWARIDEAELPPLVPPVPLAQQVYLCLREACKDFPHWYR